MSGTIKITVQEKRENVKNTVGKDQIVLVMNKIIQIVMVGSFNI